MLLSYLSRVYGQWSKGITIVEHILIFFDRKFMRLCERGFQRVDHLLPRSTFGSTRLGFGQEDGCWEVTDERLEIDPEIPTQEGRTPKEIKRPTEICSTNEMYS